MNRGIVVKDAISDEIDKENLGEYMSERIKEPSHDLGEEH